MKPIIKVMTAAALATTVLAVAPASAVTYVDTGTQTGQGGGASISFTQYVAGRFTLATAAKLTDISGYLGSFTADTIRVSLRANTTDRPGASLYSANFTALANGGLRVGWQGVSGQNWTLDAGTYWLSFDNLTGTGVFASGSPPSPLTAYAFSSNQGATWAEGGMFGLRILGDVPGAVPEPSTWAMMLVGFGMIGATARYRRRSIKTTYA